MIQDIINNYNLLSDAVRKLNKFYVREGQVETEANAYLQKRGLGEDVCNMFGIGYSPSTELTLQFLQLNNIPVQSLVDAGVFGAQYNLFDRFSGRITFALKDPFGKLVGFSGRVLIDSLDSAKYLNSKTSPIFQKSLLLYNLHNAIPFIKKQNYAILVEGMMDVITFWLSGVGNSIAPCGTSLTEEQCKLLKIYTNNVIICYDNDEGGIKSLPRILTLFQNEKMNAYTINLSGAKDPDEFIKKYSVQPILSAISAYKFA